MAMHGGQKWREKERKKTNVFADEITLAFWPLLVDSMPKAFYSLLGRMSWPSIGVGGKIHAEIGK